MRRSLILYTGLAVFVVYYGFHAFRLPMFGDFPVYLAAVHALYIDSWLPAHETMSAQGAHSVWYSPYTVLVSFVGKMLQVSPYRALLFAGVTNLLLYAGSIVFFFRTFASRPNSPWPPLIFLAVSLFLRSESFEWSSETSHAAILYIQAYPSFLGWSIALIAFALVERVVRKTQGLATLAALTLLIAFLLLSHLITASWVIGIVGLRGLYAVVAELHSAYRPAQLGSTVALREAVVTFGGILAAIVAAVCLSLLWPYYSLFQLGDFGTVVEAAPFGDRPFHFMLGAYTLGLIAAIQAIKAGRHLFLIVAFIATTGAWAAFHLGGFDYGDRYVFFMAFFPQVMIADAASRAIDCVRRKTPSVNQTRFSRIGAGMFLAVLGAAIFLAPSMRGEWNNLMRSPYFLWRLPAAEEVFYKKWDPFRAALRPGDIVMMPYKDFEAAMYIAAVTGARMVAVAYSDDVPDFAVRKASTERFFSRGASAATRLNELKRWHANKIVLVAPALNLEPDMEALFGESIYHNASAIVFSVGQ
jgi:hypothetical protein